MSMNAETLERLLIDRECGELPSDTSELLEAYLQAAPQAATTVAAIEETLHLAKQALAPSSQPVLPRASCARPPRIIELKSKSDWRLAQWAYGMAACFIGGLVLGWFVTRATVLPPHHAPAVANQPASQPVAVASGFWSASRIYKAASTAAPASANDQLIWESPVKKPQINRSYDY